MFSAPSRVRKLCCRLALLASVAAGSLLPGASTASAQKQEPGLLDRINNPDRTLAFPLTDKSFNKTTSFKNKEAYVKPYLAKGANLAGDGSFQTRGFVSSAYKAKAFDVRDGAVGQKSFGQNNKLFDTASYDVRTARDANKDAAVRAFDLHEPFAVKGKRQDTYDDLLKRKKLSIEEVRELLNKNK